MESKTWEYNGVSLELDMDDIETAERYQAAFDAMLETYQEPAEGTGTVERLRKYCEAIRFLFDRIFGDGTATKLMGERLHIGACEDAYDSFLTFVQQQTTDRTARHIQMIRKYAPNRAQKRAAAKK